MGEYQQFHQVLIPMFLQVITLFTTPVIYLYLDRFSGSGPLRLEADS